jgi:putative peptide zinc metalloprotease protein
VLCRTCHRQVERSAAFCDGCGTQLRPGPDGALELVLGDGTRVPVQGTLTIGRAPGSSLRLADPTVSGNHARLVVDAARGVLVEDDGSRYGTFFDDRRVDGPVPVRDGGRLRLGNTELLVERRRAEHEAGKTLVVRVGATIEVPAVGTAHSAGPTPGGLRPCLRSGYALKRLEAREGERRWVLKDLREGSFVRFGDGEARLLVLLDGSRDLAELVAEAEQELGPTGPAQLARLLADLGEKGLLVGVGATARDAGDTFLGRLLRPRVRAWQGAGDAFERVYRRGGWLLFSRPALAVEAIVAVAGVAAFLYLVLGKLGTPFVVARKVGLGGLVFVLGRLALATLHETAHGLAVASFGRRVSRAGVKLLMIFPYGFVEASDAYFEPRRRRLAISAAGPASDLVLGGLFSLLALLPERGTLLDVLYQLAFGAYVGALLNLNPFLDRDGYHMMVDALGLPGLRRRSRDRLRRMLSGRPAAPGDTRALTWYAGASLVWLAVSLALAAGMSLLYYDRLVLLTQSRRAVWAAFGILYAVLFLPVLLVAGRPLVQRHRAPRVRVDDVPV